MVLEDMTRQLSGWQVEILATDLSRPVLEFAKAGDLQPVRGPARPAGDHAPAPFQLVRTNAGASTTTLRAKITFRTQNLLAIPRGFGPFDLIFCRNVLFYFDSSNQAARD